MNAERVPDPGTAEILYLLVPPDARAIRRPSIADRLHFALWSFVGSASYRSLKNGFLAVLGSMGFAGLCCVGLYGLYYAKSIAGIDLFPDKHLEDFVPIPGYHRWQSAFVGENGGMPSR